MESSEPFCSLLPFERSTHTHDVVNDRRHQIKEMEEEFIQMWESRCVGRVCQPDSRPWMSGKRLSCFIKTVTVLLL